MLVLVEVDDRVATVTLNRPEARNAISAELHARARRGRHEPRRPRRRRLHGPHRRRPRLLRRHGPQVPGHASCGRGAAGAPAPPAQRSGMMPPHDTPIIGAINGPTVTGGLELAMCCDFLIASERARFADTHARVGVMPGGGMTIRLPQLVGLDRARRMSLTGDYIDAETARDWGLVVEVVPHESLLAAGPRDGGHHRVHPVGVRRRAAARYDEIGALTRPGGVARPRPRGRGPWMAERFDQSRLTSRAREDRGPGPGPDARGSTAPRREGLRGHGPAPQPARGHRPRPAGRAARLRRAARGRDGARLHGGRAPRRRAHRADHRPHQRGPGLHPQPDAARLRRLGPREAERRAVRARSRDPDPPEHRGPLRRALRRGPRSAGWATTSARCGRPSPRSPRARRPSYESPHYRVTRLQPYFNPGPGRGDTRLPPIYLGGVQRQACALAGAVADGFVSHPTNSNPRYLRETCLPALAEGARCGGPGPAPASGSRPSSGRRVITGATADAVLAERERQRRLLAFLYSTPAYAPTLELYGWAELGPAPARR